MQPIPNSIAAMADDLKEWRRDLHRNPELSRQETRTARVVADKLRDWGFDAVEEGVGKTGVVGVLHGRNGPGEAILLRADMDALPMQEESGLEHASQNPGVMHACGHDGHTTMLLGAAVLPSQGLLRMLPWTLARATCDINAGAEVTLSAAASGIDATSAPGSAQLPATSST